MNNLHMADQATSRENMGKDVSIIEMLTVLARRKRLLFIVPVVTAAIAFLCSFLIPNTYKANVKLLPPQQGQSGAAALLSQLGGVASFAAAGAGIKNPNDLYVGMLKSRTVADRLVERFKLKVEFDTDSQEKARAELEERTNISVGKDGLISIEFEASNKKLVAPLANAYSEELLKLSRVLAVTEASQRRVFFERELENAKDKLVKAEIELKRSLGEKGVVSVDADSRSILEVTSRLRAQISAKEVQVNAMKAFVTEHNQDYQRLMHELTSLKNELASLENGRANSEYGKGTVARGLENINVLRNVKYYQMLYELLGKQYEAARLDEAKETSILQVLDAATEPESKAGPRRFRIAAVAAIFSLIAALLFVLAQETKRRAMTNNVAADRWAALRAELAFKKTH